MGIVRGSIKLSNMICSLQWELLTGSGSTEPFGGINIMGESQKQLPGC